MIYDLLCIRKIRRANNYLPTCDDSSTRVIACSTTNTGGLIGIALAVSTGELIRSADLNCVLLLLS
jgi:hypothetical protein